MDRNVAFLWDESFLWGLMAYKALKANGLSFELIRSEDIKNGKLKNYTMLFVPGGWASNKLRSLGDDGAEEIKRFVRDGGNYLGLCGGAGLATLDCLGLLNVKRKPTKERVPSFSGRIYLNTDEHPIWKGLLEGSAQTAEAVNNSSLLTPHSSLIFHAWWPSQFLIEDDSIKILATYGKALPDSFSSDLNVGDVETGSNWSELEEIYQINLNPKRLLNDPAVIEGGFGKGRVILSLIHFDTPDDSNGTAVLKNLWKNLSGHIEHRAQNTEKDKDISNSLGSGNWDQASELYAVCSELISLGIRNFLWFWRNPMLLQWRRGVRGLEYCTLYTMIKEISEILKTQNTLQTTGGQTEHPPNNRRASRMQSPHSPQRIRLSAEATRQGGNTDKNLKKIRELLIPFVNDASELLILERHALRNGYITYEKCDEPEITKIRTELFSNSKSHGGLFEKLIQEIDYLLFSLLRRQEIRKLGS